MNLRFIPAPVELVDQAVPLMYSAGTEVNDWLYNRAGCDSLSFIKYAYGKDDGFYSHKRHVAAMDGDTLLGIGAFYSADEYKAMSIALVKQAMSFYPKLSLPGLGRDLMALGPWMKAPTDNMDYVANLGVAEAARGKGVGSALVLHQREVARERGKKIYALDVADNNPRAEALYLRLGFEFDSERPFSGRDRGIAVPKSRRLQQVLWLILFSTER